MTDFNYIPITESRKKLFQITQQVQTPGQVITLTERGKPKAVIMSLDEFESWKETIEALTELPDLKKEIKETEKAIEKDAYKKWTTLEQILAKHGFVLMDQSKKRYAVSTIHQTKRAKRAGKITKK
jgi:prevent-host-death family protein